MKLSKLIDPRFQNLLKKLSTEKLPLKTAFKLKGIIAMVNEEFNKYDELRMEALNKYSSKDADGKMIVDANNNIELDPAGGPKFAKELEELTSLDIPLPVLSFAELGENVSLTAEDFMILGEFIVD